MSGIAGLIGAGRQNELTAGVRAMLGAMAQRGPDGTTQWAGKGAVLGHALLRTDPFEEDQPLTDDNLTIVADVRLDNREDLIAALAPRGEDLSDARLILHAYRRWGETCPARLLGDFAFAIWDAERRCLFAARDFAGVKPFCYHAGDGRFAFASEPHAVAAAPGVPQDIDEGRIAEFLASLWPPVDRTPYAAVLRLEPAHSLLLAGGKLTLSRYWSIPQDKAAPRKDAPEQFLEIFTRAVSDRMRGLPAVGSMLSGGMDSSSITAVAGPLYKERTGLPLPTYSMVFDATPQWSERPFIEAVLADGDYVPDLINCDQAAPLDAVDADLRSQGTFHLAPALDLTRGVYERAAALGTRVLLSGHGGDEVVSHGFGRLHELAMAGRWATLWKEIRTASDMYGTTSPVEVFWGHLVNQGPLRPARDKWRRGKAKLARMAGRAEPPAPPSWSLMVNPGLATRTDLASRRADALGPMLTARTQHDFHRAMVAPRAQSYGFEILDRCAAGAGIEVRYPFWDQRLLEFCLSLEPQEILGEGYTRLVLRKAMKGVLPETVRWRPDKLDFSGHQILAMVDRNREIIDAIILEDRDDIGAYVNLESAAAAWARLIAGREKSHGGDAQVVWRTALFASWLRQAKAAPGGLTIKG